MAYLVFKALVIPKTFKVLGNRHNFQDSGALQTTKKFPIRKFPVHPNGLTGDLPKNKVKEDRNRLSASLPNLEI